MLGTNIRSIRKSKKMSINKVSELSGISVGYLSDLENNKAKNPTTDKLKAIANVLGVPVSQLLSTEEKLQVAAESINKISELAKKGLAYKTSSEDEIIRESESIYKTKTVFSEFENEIFTEEEEKEISNFIKYVLSKRK